MSYTESNADRSNMRMDFKEGGAGKGQCHEYSQDRTRISPLYLEKKYMQFREILYSRIIS